MESASHKAQVRGSQKNAFATNIFRLIVWGTRRFSPTPFFEYIIQAVKHQVREVGDEGRRARWHVIAKKRVEREYS